MIEFNIPANETEALNILRAMRNHVVTNEGGDNYKLAEVVATIGNRFFLYTSAYCAMCQELDGFWSDCDFSKGTPFWLECMTTGKLVGVNAMSVGAKQLMEAVNK